ncbi:unnamed protein product, partial [Chrysoparadoxa australica]
GDHPITLLPLPHISFQYAPEPPILVCSVQCASVQAPEPQKLRGRPRDSLAPNTADARAHGRELQLSCPSHFEMICYGQVVVGPPGSGKTTYCAGMQQYMEQLGRSVAVINLDPASDNAAYKAALDVANLVSLEAVMKELGLGPNGGLMYCVEYLERNMDWLTEQLEKLELKQHYLIFDMPGQVELYTHSTVVQSIVQRLVKADIRLAAVHVVDAHHCSDPPTFVSVVLLSLMTMMRLELPHINILSKVDLIQQYGELAFNLEFFTECLDVSRLLNFMDSGQTVLVWHASGMGEEGTEGGNMRSRFKKMNREICDVIESYGLVAFHPLNIMDAETLGRALSVIDKANGFVLGMHESQAAGGKLSL